MTALPALPAAWRGTRRRSDHFLVCATATTAADTAAEDGKENQATNTSADADDNGFVVIDPGRDLAADRSASATSILAFTATAALGAVEEVLLQTVTLVGREFRRTTSDYTGG
jgi:hypothetical protein